MTKQIIKFTAPAWCGPCKSISPIFHSIEKEYPSISTKVIDVDNSDDETLQLVDKYNVSGVPMFIFLYNNIEIKELNFTGANESKLRHGFEKLSKM